MAEQSATIVVREVEPLSGRDVVRQGIGVDARTFTCKLYTLVPVDVVNGDAVTVRGRRYDYVDVSEWKATGTRFSGSVILCGGGHG
ncbi:MAG: hypothetical protein WBA98_03750 [Gordonia sp. (in: high G+C Gram-positive bacteria)]|uniref:hypothetical protein n=1 Tax=Gordonia sp. (in: high G+C Gram-positive bacteria) TaxID=84139 RepID=UPI003C73B717